MKLTIIALALVLACSMAYDFTKPANGDELKATLKDEKDTTFVIFFHADKYEGDTDEAKKLKEVVKDIKDDVQKNCTSEGLKDSEYTFVDVELELDGTKEKEALFGKLLKDLGFEEASDDAAAGDDAAPAEEAARRSLQDEEAAADGDADAAAAGDDAAEPEELPKLQAAPYALVMRNQQGYRVSGNNISTELCYQAKQFKQLAEKQESAKK